MFNYHTIRRSVHNRNYILITANYGHVLKWLSSMIELAVFLTALLVPSDVQPCNSNVAPLSVRRMLITEKNAARLMLSNRLIYGQPTVGRSLKPA